MAIVQLETYKPYISTVEEYKKRKAAGKAKFWKKRRNKATAKERKRLAGIKSKSTSIHRKGRKYQLARKDTLIKADGVCQYCNQRRGLIVHHTVMIKDNPLLAAEYSNMVAICDICYEEQHPWLKLKTN